MKTILSKLVIVLMFMSNIVLAQSRTVANANVYPSNLEENMYFESYDASSKTIKGITFQILCDGDNSTYVTPAFTVKLYIWDGQSPVFFKTFDEKSIFHMGSKEYKSLDISLADVDLSAGTYRLGVYVNADKDFEENPDDNATLFKGEITIE